MFELFVILALVAIVFLLYMIATNQVMMMKNQNKQADKIIELLERIR